MAQTETRSAVTWSPGKEVESCREGLKIIGIADGPGKIGSSVGAPKHEIIGRRRFVVNDCQ